MEAPSGIDLDQTVQNALRDLLSVAALNHDDNWEASAPSPPRAQPSASFAGRNTARNHDSRAPPAGNDASVSSLSMSSGPSIGDEVDEGSDVQEKDLPPQAAARLYQARLRAAQAELAGLQDAVKSRDIKLGTLEKELQQLRQERAAWQKQQKSLEAAAERSRRAAEDAKARLVEQETALRQVGLERRASQQERRQTEADLKARESKLSAALEEAQRLRKLLEEAKAQAASRAGVSREEHARVVAENRQLAAQKQELVVAFRKAGKLIEVLRRQRVHLEAAALLKVSSRELAEALQQGQAGSSGRGGPAAQHVAAR